MKRSVVLLVLSVLIVSCHRSTKIQDDTAGTYSRELRVLLNRHTSWVAQTNMLLGDALLNATRGVPFWGTNGYMVNVVMYGGTTERDVRHVSIESSTGTVADLLNILCSSCSTRCDVVEGVIAVRQCADTQPILPVMDVATSNALRRMSRDMVPCLAVECTELWFESVEMLECMSGAKVVVDPRIEETHLHGQHVCDPVHPYLFDLPLEYAASWACRMHGAKCRVIGGAIFILPDDNGRRWHESRRVGGKADVWPGLEKAYRRFMEMAVEVGLKEEASGACDRYIELFPERKDDACVQKWKTMSQHR